MSMNRRRISISIASGLLLEAINKISPLLILHHAQKTLGLADFGWAQYQLAFFETIQPFISYGFANYALADSGAAEKSADGMRANFSNIFILKCCNALGVLLVFLLWNAPQLTSEVNQHSIGILSLVLLCTVFDSYWFCMAKHKLAQVSLISGVLRIVSLGLILFLVSSSGDKKLFIFLSLLPNSLIAIGSGIYAYRELGLIRVQWQQMKTILLRSTPFAVAVLLLTLFDRLDIFLIKRWFSLESAGIYAAPWKVIQSISLLTASIATPFYAEIIKIEDRQSIYKHTALGLWCLMVIVAPVVFGIPFVEDDVLRLLFTDLPASANHLMSLLSYGMIGGVLFTIFGILILMAKSKTGPILSGFGICLLAVPLFIWLFKERLGFAAAAWGMIAGKTFMGFYCMYHAKEFMPKLPWSALFKPLLAGAGMGFILLMLELDSAIKNVLLGGPVYILLLIVSNFKELKEILQHPKIKGLLQRLRLS